MFFSIVAARKQQKVFALFAFFALVLAPFGGVKAQMAPTTMGTLVVTKTVVGSTTPASAFSFSINGGSLTSFEADGSNSLSRTAGTYTVTETPKAGFVTSYSGCNNINLVAFGTSTCAITNTATSTQGGGQPQTGVLKIKKIIVGAPGSTADDFTFDVVRNTAQIHSNIAFDADGTTVFNETTGVYTVTEDAAPGFTTSYTNSTDSDQNCNLMLLTPNATTTCTITNTSNTSATTTTGTLVIKKVVIGGTHATSSFSFKVNGGATTTFDSDGINRIGNTATGTYTIRETPISNYIPSYTNCSNVAVTSNATTTCTIINRLSTSGVPTASTTGTLVVKKIVTGGNGATSSFKFLINGTATTTFEMDGTNRLTNMSTGTYFITELPTANYTPSYSNCSNVLIIKGATTTCTITNRFNVNNVPLYEIDGFVWNDVNSDGVFDPSEPPLPNWTVHATAPGQLVREDLTDQNGYYSVLVATGTWMVAETLQTNWQQVFPASNNSHTVIIPNASSTDYNFGNIQVSTGGSGGGGGGGGGGRSSNNNNNNNNDNNNDGDDDNTSNGDGGTSGPTGQVLGEQTSVLPQGAPNTGEGGAEMKKLSGNATVPMLATIFLLLLGFGISSALRDKRDDEERV